MPDKNWCQNPKCAGRETGRYHKSTNTFRSKYSYSSLDQEGYSGGLDYDHFFCSYTCLRAFCNTVLPQIMQTGRYTMIRKRISVPAEEYTGTKQVKVNFRKSESGYDTYDWKDVPCKRQRVVSSVFN